MTAKVLWARCAGDYKLPKGWGGCIKYVWSLPNGTLDKRTCFGIKSHDKRSTVIPMPRMR